MTEIRDQVRERYARHAVDLPADPTGPPPTLGVGDPLLWAQLEPGETVLDLGSGPGRDLFAAARAVGPGGRAVGVDMTPEMIERSRRTGADLANVSVIEGDLERLPLPCSSVDVVISNCVINLVEDKRRALVEAYRVLTPGGRLAIVDTAFDTEPPEHIRADADSWSCCVGGALVTDDYAQILQDIGFRDVRIEILDASCGELCSSDATVRSVAVTAAKPGDHPGQDVPRPAVPADRPAIDALLEASELPASGLHTSDAIVLDGGVVALQRYGEAALLRSLAVPPDRRGAGLGTRLVLAALEVARWSGAGDVHLLTPAPRVSFFERLGFRPVARRTAGAACPSELFADPACDDAVAMRLSFEEADLPALGRPSRKELPTFQSGACC